MKPDLRPFIPGGFMSGFLGYFEKNYPDLTANNLDVLKVVGLQSLALLTALHVNEYRRPPASMYLILVGDPKSGKGTILSEIRDKLTMLYRVSGNRVKIIGEPSPPALGKSLSNWHWKKTKNGGEWTEHEPAGPTLMVVEEAGRIFSTARCPMKSRRPPKSIQCWFRAIQNPDEENHAYPYP